jgi:phosphoglycerate kinase
LMEMAESRNVRILLPVDLVITQELSPDALIRTVRSSEVPEGWIIADIGSRTAKEFTREISASGTVFWNGPLGVFEIAAFAEGTKQIARAMARLDGMTVVGGGSTAEAVNELGLRDRISHVSTGGGAALMLVGGESLPGVEALPDA